MVSFIDFSHLRKPIRWRFEAYVSEFIGTYFLVLTVGVNVLQNTSLAPISVGAMLMAMIFSTGSVSGGHFNPAVSFAVWLADTTGKMDFKNMCVYWFAQVLGGLFAGLTYYEIFGAVFALSPGKGYDAFDAATAEVLFSAALTFVVLSVACARESQGNGFYGLAIGFTVMAAAFAIGPISGCSLNPAITCGVMWTYLIVTNSQVGMIYFWLYLLGPMLGACAGAVLYRVVRHAEFQEAQDGRRYVK